MGNKEKEKEKSEAVRCDKLVETIAARTGEEMLNIPEVEAVAIVVNWGIEGNLPAVFWYTRKDRATVSMILKLCRSMASLTRELTTAAVNALSRSGKSP